MARERDTAERIAQRVNNWVMKFLSPNCCSVRVGIRHSDFLFEKRSYLGLSTNRADDTWIERARVTIIRWLCFSCPRAFSLKCTEFMPWFKVPLSPFAERVDTNRPREDRSALRAICCLDCDLNLLIDGSLWLAPGGARVGCWYYQPGNSIWIALAAKDVSKSGELWTKGQ